MPIDNIFDTIVIEDGRYTIPIWVSQWLNGISEDATSPSSLFAAGGGEGKYGDAEPGFAFNEQRTWEGGRGLDFFSDDRTRYFDSKGAWSLTPGKIGPAPQWFRARGYRPNGEERVLPGNVTWRPLYDATRYVDRLITPSANITADKVRLWVRRVGDPTSDLTLELCDDDGSGSPGTVLKTVVVDIDDITDYLSVFQVFDWTGTQALTASTDYHLKIYGGASDHRDAHWEVGVDAGTEDGLYSDDDSSWTAADYSLYYDLTGVDHNCYHVPFELDQQFYFVSIYEDGTASRLWMVGDRGKATAGTSTTLTDSNRSYGTADKFVGAIVKIIRGTGARQVRTISAHTDTELTVSSAWLITPSTDSEYIIYQTPWLREIATTGLGVVTDVAVQDNIAYFAQGEATNIRKIRFNPGASPPAHEFADDSTNKASLLEPGYKDASSPIAVLWRANNDATAAGAVTVSRAPAVTWGSTHTFATAIKAGNGNYPITNLVDGTSDGNSRLYVFKTGENGYIQGDKWFRDNINIGAFPEATNGLAAKIHGLYRIFGWTYTVERQYGEAVDDLDPNREAGFPEGRQGYLSAIESHPVGWLGAFDAGDDGTSSVQFFDGVNYHEVIRGFDVGKRIRSLAWQPNEGGVKYLWVSMGDDLVFMEFPRHHRDPYKGAGQKFMHEFSFVTATLDMTNSSIYKFWKDLTLISQNLDGVGRKLIVDVQTDTDIGTNTWTYPDIGEARESPSDILKLALGGSRQMRYRVRGYTNDATIPAFLNGATVKGVGQLPIRFVASCWASFGPIADKLGGSGEDAIDVITRSARTATAWTIGQSAYKRLVGRLVLVSVQRVRPQYLLNDRDNANALITFIQMDD